MTFRWILTLTNMDMCANIFFLTFHFKRNFTKFNGKKVFITH